jgi:hypothetical protein
MKTRFLIRVRNLIFLLLAHVFFVQCEHKTEYIPGESPYRILFLHHSTGMTVWKGDGARNEKLKRFFGIEPVYDVPEWFAGYNLENNKDYLITERSFPKGEPYPWNNYPYDYYTIWVKNAGEAPYREEPTLEMLTKEYDMIIFKHCFPVSLVKADIGTPDPDSPEKRLENYKAQYAALKQKMHEFPGTKFLVWTGAANVEKKTKPEYAERARDFFSWVKSNWDQPGDNIYLWDFYQLETDGGLYLKDDYARNSENSHPNPGFTSMVAPLLSQRIVDVIETNGQNTTLTGNKKN